MHRGFGVCNYPNQIMMRTTTGPEQRKQKVEKTDLVVEGKLTEEVFKG